MKLLNKIVVWVSQRQNRKYLMLEYKYENGLLNKREAKRYNKEFIDYFITEEIAEMNEKYNLN